MGAIILLGLAAAIGSIVWWQAELSDVLGPNTSGGFECLLNFGTGECHQLWFVGLHQTNQIASLIFYGGVAAIIAGLATQRPRSTTEADEKPERRPPTV